MTRTTGDALLLVLALGSWVIAEEGRSNVVMLRDWRYRCTVNKGAAFTIEAFAENDSIRPVRQHQIRLEAPEGFQVRLVRVGPWMTDRLFAVAQCRKDRTFEYFGISFPEATADGHVDFVAHSSGKLFASDENYNSMQISPMNGDSMSVWFSKLKRGSEGTDFQGGVLFVHHCPQIPSPGELFSFDGKVLFREAAEFVKAGGPVEAPYLHSTKKGK